MFGLSCPIYGKSWILDGSLRRESRKFTCFRLQFPLFPELGSRRPCEWTIGYHDVATEGGSFLDFGGHLYRCTEAWCNRQESRAAVKRSEPRVNSSLIRFPVILRGDGHEWHASEMLPAIF